MEADIKRALDMAEDDNGKINVITYYLNLFQQINKELQDKIRYTETQIDELTLSLASVKETDKERDALFNIGAGIFVPGKSVKDDMFIDVGSSYVLKTNPEEVLDITQKRLDVQIQLLTNYTDKYHEYIQQVSELNTMGQEILRQHQMQK